ncbi:MAG TPA: hypothetical protein DGJ56_02615 [Verrucomicrobiales bacterium]|nr:hypothetical protein [Verrucomicrobiales bacterium]
MKLSPLTCGRKFHATHHSRKCMDIMGKYRVRHLPVVEKGKVVGVITSTDLLILTINEKDNIIEELERFISSGGY